MSDIERLESQFDQGRLLRPTAELPNTVDLALAIASACGGSGRELSRAARQVAQQIRGDHIVLVLVDGLGMNLIEDQPGSAFLASHLHCELRSVFPSTTATALTSLATGLWPGQHALPGWWTYLPAHSITATILPFVERFTERPLSEMGIVPESAYVAPVEMPLFARDVCSFLPQEIAKSAYTQYTTGGTRSVGYGELSEAVDDIIGRVNHANHPTYTYLYVPVIDALQHAVGPRDDRVRAAMNVLDGELSRLASGVSARARVIISADHGLTGVAENGRHLVPDGLLQLLLVPPTGEPRVPYFHVKPGKREQFAERFSDRFGDRFVLLTTGEAEELGLFGPEALSSVARERIGDFVGIALGNDVLLSKELRYRGFHGGLTPDEMRIPLILA